MSSRKILFLCSQNKLRSPTAEAIFADTPGIEVDSAGLNRDAEVPLCPEQLEWADVILVMEKAQQSRLTRHYGPYLKGKRIAVLNIPDEYECMDPELIRLLEIWCAPYLP
jgi:predicted protein tyrosine phosphatase